MAEFRKVMEQYDRMCNGMGCINCPIASANNGTDTACHLFMRVFPEKAERIIMQWAEKNPIMTNRRKFEEVFGFNIATMFEVNRGNAGWLDEKYKDGDGNSMWLDSEYEGDNND